MFRFFKQIPSALKKKKRLKILNFTLKIVFYSTYKNTLEKQLTNSLTKSPNDKEITIEK